MSDIGWPAEVNDEKLRQVRLQLCRIISYRNAQDFVNADFLRNDLAEHGWKVSVGLGERVEDDRWWAGRHLTVTVSVPGATATKRLRVVVEEP